MSVEIFWEVDKIQQLKPTKSNLIFKRLSNLINSDSYILSVFLQEIIFRKIFFKVNKLNKKRKRSNKGQK